jgi:hypothetical protein
VMDLLGHSTFRLTADTYGHLLPSRARKATEGIDRIMRAKGQENNEGSRIRGLKTLGCTSG